MTPRPIVAAIVGAGPYGLSIAAHLRERGLPFRIFGSPMSFWRRMPASINLKSFAYATNVYVPRPGFTFPEYCRRKGLEDFEPCSMASFADYGSWVQQRIAPHLEPTDVTGLSREGDAFALTLANGDRLRAPRVVLAVGLGHFPFLPPAIADLPRTHASHSSEYTEFAPFAGKDIAVIGAGASALETATILHEIGARTLLFVRESKIVFHSKFDRNRSLLARIKNPNSVLGPGRKSWALARFPMAFHYLPEERRVRFVRSYLGPSGPWWLADRFHGKVPFRLRSQVTAARVTGDRVSLEVTTADQGQRTTEFDHVIAGTGFEVDVDRLPFLDPALRAAIRRVERAPDLSRHFESSVPGLYFVGTAAAFSFGPLFRFVAGAEFAAPIVAKHVAAQCRRLAAVAVPSTRAPMPQ